MNSDAALGVLFYGAIALVFLAFFRMKKARLLDNKYFKMSDSDLNDLVNLGDKAARDELRDRIIRKQKE